MKGRSKDYKKYGWLAPAAVVVLALSVYPLIYMLQISFTGQDEQFTTVHYGRLLGDEFFHRAVWQTFIYTGAALIVELTLGLALALLVDSLGRGRALFRVGMLTPMLVPPVVAALLWRLIYNAQFGVLNGTLRSLGFDTTDLTWTAAESSAMFSVIVVDVWEWTPFMFLLLTAGLQAVPRDPIEAAKIDGASYWRILRDVILPLMKPTILLAIVLRFMDLIRIFDQIFILTRGGPGFATETVSLYIYKTAFRFFNFGYAAAMSFVVLLLTIFFAQGLMRVMKTRRAA